ATGPGGVRHRRRRGPRGAVARAGRRDRQLRGRRHSRLGAGVSPERRTARIARIDGGTGRRRAPEGHFVMTTSYLAYFPSPPRGVWYLGPVPIRAYALFIIVGIVVALLIGDRRWAARGGERGVIYDIALWVVPFGLLGGRLYHLATDWRTYF